MKCERCNKKDAIVSIVQIVGMKENTIWLCEDCARGLIQMSKGDGENFSKEGTIQNILNTFLDVLNKSKKDDGFENIICSNCGTSYRDFKKDGVLGCEDCYINLKKKLRPFIKRVHGDLEHIGKVPLREGTIISISKKIKKLRRNLQNAIIDEEYERAALIRDEIRDLENISDEGGDYNGNL